jgi:hypothetical protein
MILNKVLLRKTRFILRISSIFILSALSLIGCGSGGGGNNAQPAVSRELLAGTTERSWKLVVIRGNANYEGGGVDTPCPATLNLINDPSTTFFCDATDRFQLRSNGSFTYLGVGIDWTLDGSTMTLNMGRAFGVLTSTVIVEPVANGAPQRLRLRQVSYVLNGERDTEDDGSEIVIEEIVTSTGGGGGGISPA